MRLDETIKAYFRADGAGIVAVYLFGSQAAGKDAPGSDVDIAVLFDSIDKESIRSRIEGILVQLPRVLRRDIHPVAMNSASEALLAQIFSKGRCLLVNDPSRLSEFRMVAYARIAGFSHYRKKMQDGLIRRVMGGA
jgi:predicted nucleotidyltransferase